MRELAEEGDHRAQILIKLTEQPAHFMTAIRVTVTTAGFLQSAFAAEYFAQPMTAALIRSGIDVPQNVLKIVCMNHCDYTAFLCKSSVRRTGAKTSGNEKSG